jgi:hypothetical protein
VDAHRFIKQDKKCKNLVCQRADGNCLLGEEWSADDGIHATRDHNNVKSVLRNTKETA